MRTLSMIGLFTTGLCLSDPVGGFTAKAPNKYSRIQSGNGGLSFSLQTPPTKEVAKETAKSSRLVSDSWSQVSPAESFDPLQLAESSQGDQTLALEVPEKQEEQDKQELTLWAARGILLLVAVIWGTNFACVKYLNGLCFNPPCTHPPSEFAFARFGIAALVSIPLLLKERRDVILAGFECGLWITLGYITQSMALATISAGECAFICSLTVVFVPIVSLILYGKPLKVKDLLAGAIAISGVAVLEGMLDVTTLLDIEPAAAQGAIEASSAATSAAASSSVESAMTTAVGPIDALARSLGVSSGDILALGQPLGFGFAFTRIEHYQEQFKEVPNRVLTIAAAQCVMVGFLSFFWVLYDYNGVIPDFGYMIEPHRIATLAWTGIITTLVAIYMEGIALQKASATDASIAFASEPVWASLFGFLLLHETLGLDAYVGGSIILLACLYGAVSDLQQESSQDDDAQLVH